jgi:hypothetical protein
MNRLTFLIVAVGSLMATRAEILIGPTDAVNHLIVGTNEVAMIRVLDTANKAVSIVMGEREYKPLLGIGTFPGLIAGPSEVLLGAGTLISYQIVGNSSIKSRFVGTNEFAAFALNADEKILLYSALSDVQVEVSQNGRAATIVINGRGRREDSPVEIDGPANVVAGGFYSTSILTYQIIKRSASNPQNSQVGPSLIELHRSSNLFDWETIALQPSSGAPLEFYRMKLTK